MKQPDPASVAEERQSLWLLVYSLLIWAFHFLFIYVVAALWCGGTQHGTTFANEAGNMTGLRVVVGAATALALTGIAVNGWAAWQRFRLPGGEDPYDDDSSQDRHRFLGMAAMLLSGLSAGATFYVAAAALLVGHCW